MEFIWTKKYTADEVIEIIQKKMENGERWDLLNELYDKYYNIRKHPRADIEENY